MKILLSFAFTVETLTDFLSLSERSSEKCITKRLLFLAFEKRKNRERGTAVAPEQKQYSEQRAVYVCLFNNRESFLSLNLSLSYSLKTLFIHIAKNLRGRERVF